MENLGFENGPKGLSPEHSSELNGFLSVPVEIRRERYASLRQEYAEDPRALREIDIFDKESPYGQSLQKLIVALRTGDEQAVQEIEDWFALNYPKDYTA